MVTKVSDDGTFQARQAAYKIKKKQLALQVKQAAHSGRSLAIKKKTSNLFRNRPQTAQSLDVRDFNQVLSIDLEAMTADVEGMTTYADLVAETLKYGCLPTVVPELKSITIGGALAGVGIESSSFRYGLVHETILAYDVLLGNGDIIECRADNEHADLFRAFPNSYGTLGYALKVTVKLIATKPYLKLHHQHFTDTQSYYTTMDRLCRDNQRAGEFDYIEGVMFSPQELVITTASFVDEAPYCSNYRYMNIYYRSLQQRDEDYLTALDYIWRWDPDWFWCSKVFGMQNPVLRFLLGKWLLKSTAYWKIKHWFAHQPLLKNLLNRFCQRTESVIQDVAIPIEHAADFYEFFHQTIKITPVWNCPIMPFDQGRQYDLFRLDPGRLYINFGFWDMVPSQKSPGYYNRLVENKVAELGGVKSLYSEVYYSEEQFWQQYDKTAYETAKDTYDADGRLRDLYAKCTEKLT